KEDCASLRHTEALGKGVFDVVEIFAYQVAFDVEIRILADLRGNLAPLFTLRSGEDHKLWRHQIERGLAVAVTFDPHVGRTTPWNARRDVIRIGIVDFRRLASVRND